MTTDYEALLYADARFFFRELWLEIGSETEDGKGRAPLSEVEYDLIDYLDSGPRRRVIAGTRGIGKSYLAAGKCARAWFRDPNRKVIYVSKSQEAANKTSTLLRSWFNTVPFLRHLAPAGLDSIIKFNVGCSTIDRQPSFFAIGIGGQLENNRAHTIVADDVETKKNTTTLAARTELRRMCGEFVNILFPSRPPEEGGPVDPNEIVYLITPKHEETIINDLEEEGFDVRTYPLCVPEPGEINFPLAPTVREMIAAGRYRKSDGCLLPHRFTEEDVSDRRAKRSEWLRECQIVRTLGESDRYPLKLRNFIVYEMDNLVAPIHLAWGTRTNTGSTALDIKSLGFGDDRFYAPFSIDQNVARYTGTKMRVDQAGRGADVTAYAVASHLNGFIFLKRLGGLKGGGTDYNMQKLAEIARDANVQTITVETNFGGDTYANMLQTACNRLKIEVGNAARPEGWSCVVETKHTTGQKELRIIEQVEPFLGNHRVVITPQIAAMPEFQRQVTRLTREPGCLEHDDYIDVLGQILGDWSETTRIDPARIAVSASDEARKIWLDRRNRDRSRGERYNWFGRTKH
jgi:hypothetical protein